MAMISENWADLLDPIVRWNFYLGFNRRPSLISTLFHEQGSVRADEQVSGVGAVGIDAWEQWEQSGTVGEAKYDQAYKKTYTHREYPLEVAIRSKLVADAQDNEVINIPQRIGDSARLKREVDAASVFNNAFDSNFAGGDAVELCDASHPHSPQKPGSSQSNIFTGALTMANLKTVREAMMAFTDDNGNFQAVTPDLLLVPPGLEDKAKTITNSILDPDSGNNAINPQFGRFSYLVWHHLSDANNWFLIDRNLMRMSLDWFNRVPLGINPKVEDKTLVATWIAYMRYSFGFSDWRWVGGSSVA